MSVIIITLPGDVHAHAIAWAIRRLDGEARILYPFDLCGRSQWSIDPETGVLQIESTGYKEYVRRNEYKTIWMRRPAGIFPLHNIKDTVQRAVAEEELRIFSMGIIRWLEVGKFVVNSVQSTSVAGHKSFQLALAAEMGLNGPKTLISNSPTDILTFFDFCGGEFIYKPLKSALWTLDDGRKSIVPTTVIRDRSILLGADLRSGPGIYQEMIVKQAEIRATFIGKSIFAWEKRFNHRPHEDLDIDWRAMNTGAEHKLHRLPADITEKCFKLMSALDLHFGAFDFVIDQNGNYQFLEVNPQGQFLWGDQLGLGLNQMEAFAEFLLSGDSDFKYSYANRLNLADFYTSGNWEKEIIEESAMHDGNLMEYNYKQISLAV